MKKACPFEKSMRFLEKHAFFRKACFFDVPFLEKHAILKKACFFKNSTKADEKSMVSQKSTCFFPS
jgi:hypothetical protein